MPRSQSPARQPITSADGRIRQTRADAEFTVVLHRSRSGASAAKLMLGRDFKIAVRVAPAIAVTILAKLAVDALGWDVVELNSLYSGLVTATVFLIGFLLAGTLTDFKESEKLPSEIAGRIETIADECEILFVDKSAQPARDCLEHLEEISTAISAWLHGRGDSQTVMEKIQRLNLDFLAFEPLTQPNFIVRLKQEQSALRLLVLRINTIRETSFVGAGYLIAELTSVLLISSLLFADIAQRGAEIFLLGMVAFVLAYMIALIKDLDNPFDYDGDKKSNSAEVSLAVIHRLEERIASRREALEAQLA
jgi:hypothetical protein